jgi:parvulin-like peptidyl-prolyl isomerase
MRNPPGVRQIHVLRAAALLAGMSLAAVLPAFTVAAAEPEPEATRDRVIARVGKVPIYRSEFETALKRAGGDRLRSSDQRLRLEAELLDQLVNERLLRQIIEAEKIAVDPEEVSTLLVRMRSQLSDRRIDFDAFLSQVGRDEESLRGQIELELALKKLIAPQLTNQAIAAAFEERRRELDGTRLRASHILLRPDPARGDDAVADLVRKAEAIRREILQGGISFAAAARKYSAGPSRRQGGDVGFFPRQGAVHEDFAREAFALAKGDISKPFVTPSGVHLIVVTGVEPGNGSLDALRPLVEKLVVQRVISGLLEQARATTTITYAPGVPHFDGPPAGGTMGLAPRRIVVAEAVEPAVPAGK